MNPFLGSKSKWQNKLLATVSTSKSFATVSDSSCFISGVIVSMSVLSMMSIVVFSDMFKNQKTTFLLFPQWLIRLSSKSCLYCLVKIIKIVVLLRTLRLSGSQSLAKKTDSQSLFQVSRLAKSGFLLVTIFPCSRQKNEYIVKWEKRRGMETIQNNIWIRRQALSISLCLQPWEDGFRQKRPL